MEGKPYYGIKKWKLADSSCQCTRQNNTWQSKGRYLLTGIEIWGYVNGITGHHTLSVKLSEFTVWCHTWRKNWVNCAVLTDNRAGIKIVLSSRISHRELRSSLRESHSFLSLPADTTKASSQGNQFIQQMSIAWYIPFQIPLLTPYFTFSFLLFG
jgi:hypothetical protein